MDNIGRQLVESTIARLEQYRDATYQPWSQSHKELTSIVDDLRLVLRRDDEQLEASVRIARNLGVFIDGTRAALAEADFIAESRLADES